MMTIKFIWLLWTGVLVPAGEHEGIPMYNIIVSETEAIEYAYKPEVIQYIKTGVFTYDNTMDEATVEPRDIVYDWIDENPD